MITSKENKFL